MSCSQTVMAAKPALVVTDSMGRDLVPSRKWQLQFFPGLTTPRLLDMLMNRRIPLHAGLRLIVVHVGTNDADEGPRNRNRQSVLQTGENCSAIRDQLQEQVPGVRVVWSMRLGQVLPQGEPGQHGAAGPIPRRRLPKLLEDLLEGYAAPRHPMYWHRRPNPLC